MKSMIAAVTFGLALSSFGALFASSDARASTPVHQASQQKVAVIKIVIQERDGTIVRAPVKAVHWSQTASFELRSKHHRHTVQLRPARDNGSFAVDMDYSRDGSAVTSRQSVAVGARRSSVVHRDDGAKVTVTVIPTKVTVDTQP